MILADYHTHTNLSFDGDRDCSPDALCAAAIEKGITDLAITDHYECNWQEFDEYDPFNTQIAYERIMAAKEKYAGRLNLAYGIELGQINQAPDEAIKVLRENKFDFVLCSVHNISNHPDFYFMDFTDPEIQEKIPYMFDKSIDELCDSLDIIDGIDSVAHITYMRRYAEMAGVRYDYTRHFDHVKALFDKIISKDIALEVNVSTLWKGLGFAMPDESFLQLYKDCGGKLLTVGTDTHSTQNVGRSVKDGLSIIKSIGFDSIMTVRDGKKILNKI
jgi:histidinol-phosphatase (PHP family)